MPKRNSDAIKNVLEAHVVPFLKEAGFRGSFPHFRRKGTKRLDLLTFQFDKNSGGFIVELGKIPPTDFTTQWGKVIPHSQVTAWDLSTNDRARLYASSADDPLSKGTEGWFRYDRKDQKSPADQIIEAVELVRKYFNEVEAWFAEGHSGSLKHIREMRGDSRERP
jgi:hypothetical protein